MASAGTRRLTLAICCGAHGVQDGLGATLYVLAPVLAQAFGLSFAEIGLLRAIKNTATTLLELPSGLLAERIGERRLLGFGLVCGGAGFIWLANAMSYRAILASLFVVGVGAAFQHALSSSIISRTYADHGRRSALGLYNSSGDAGKLSLTALFSLSLGVGWAWQGVVSAFGLTAVLFSGVAWIGLRKLAAGDEHHHAAANKAEAKQMGWGIRDGRGFAALCLTVFLDTAVQSGFLVFLAFLIAEKEVPVHLAAFAVVLTLVGGMFGKAGCGFLAERVGVRRSFALAQCATAAGIVAILASPTLIAFAILPVVGMFLQGSTSITYGAVSDLIHSNRQSRGFGLIYSVSSSASIAGPVAFGLLSDNAGLAIAMYAMALVSILAIPSSLMLRSRISEHVQG